MKTLKGICIGRVFVSLLICVFIVSWNVQVSAEEWTEAHNEVWESAKSSWEYLAAGVHCGH